MRRGAAARAGVVVVPLVVAAVVGGLVRWRRPHLTLTLSFGVWSAVLVLGVLGAGVAALALAHRRRVGRARVTAAAQARSEAEQRADSEHRRFVSRLDHELKNPITAMRAAVTNLDAGLAGTFGPGDERRNALAILDAQSERLARVTGDLRKLAAVENAPLDTGPIEPERLLAEVVDDGIELGRAVSPTVTVELDLPRRPWPLATFWGDRDLLHLALLNVVANAVKFSAGGGVVTVGARDDVARDGSGWLTAEVTDAGIGMPAEELPLIWEELARGEGARGLPGSGIGLAMVRTIVLRHGGDCTVRSVVGRGTVVAVRLPVRAAPRAGTAVDRPADRPLQTGTDVAEPVHDRHA